ncbi:MAG: antibiotic ABC transporter permease, partial [Lactobacillaceae bacterium]
MCHFIRTDNRWRPMTLRLMMIRIGLKRSVANRYAFGFY